MDQAQQLRNIIKNQSKPQRPLARIITVTSGKGGVGKSNTSINLAIQFRKLGQRVIILDADFGHLDPQLALVMGAKASVTVTGNDMRVDYLNG